jgi:tRNA(Leu) C34 or U34 (ribose-2'-O)-methylase TrmL
MLRKGGEEREMADKKKTKGAEENKFVCKHCGLDCHDKVKLERHLDWAHKDQKNAVK